MNVLGKLINSRIWWLSIAIACVLLEGVALYYQYALDYLPCVLCIHVRMLLAALLLVSAIAVIINSRVVRISCQLLSIGTLLVLVERSWKLLAVERGWLIGDCEMTSGLPEWLALESWLPAIFKIHEPCGYTPYILFEISMAELLLAGSIIALLVMCLILIAKKVK